MALEGFDGTKYEDKVSPAKPPTELDKTFVEFEGGEFLGNMTIKAIKSSDYKDFQEASRKDFGGDDWRTFKFMLNLYKDVREMFKYLRPEKVEEKPKNGPSKN